MKARDWVVRSAVGVMALALVTSGAWGQGVGRGNRPAAVVDGVPISLEEVDAVLKQAPPTPAPLSEVQRRQLRMEAVAMLVDDLLMQQFLNKNGPRITPAEVDKKLAELDDSLKTQKKTRQEFLRESSQTEAQLRANVTTMLQWAGYIKEHLSDAEVEQYYKENKEFFDRVVVRASHIVIRISPTALENDRRIVREKLEALRQEIVAGKIEFAEAAKKNSQCTSAAGGGDIGYFPRKLAVEEAFARAAFGLKVGDVSDVVQTGYGMHLIKVTDRKPGQPSDFKKVKEDVRELCTEEIRQAILAQQRKIVRVDINLP